VAARRVTVASATQVDNILPELVAEVVGNCSPRAVLALASFLSFAEMWRHIVLPFELPVFDAAL
jgi:hypothetical protein